MDNGILSVWTDTLFSALYSNFEAFFAFLPNLIAALIIFGLGWVIAGFVRNVTLKVLEVAQLEPFAEKVGISKALQRAGATITPNGLIAEIIRWAVILVFLNPTVEILGLSQASVLINQVLLYIPNVIISAVILMVGMIFADLTSQFIKGTAAALGTGAANAISSITKYAIIVFVILASLSQLGIAKDIIQALVFGFVAMIALAGGLAFGLGGKDVASRILNDLYRNLKDKEY